MVTGFRFAYGGAQAYYGAGFANYVGKPALFYGALTDIPVRIYWPPIAQHDNLPVVVFYHGGGWCLGDLETHDPVARGHSVSAEAIAVVHQQSGL